ncbi:hypothetical protein WEU38_18275 (plasmid) [Cyanobacterium aponinum AL20118]|uniref:Uncharacterized protein n=1 Tax=Cyanobacterium aponinum AL20115 TaxID=3090662 RepID=A0AAF1C413_9CHRO|nr:hypothetical protein [Cyanobacterium aponinum]WPF90518.1 hypothetical protein SAY89_18360 [Cyanobacterium aponinum AL20115]
MVSLNSLRNLKQGEQPTKWKNTPTKAVRIPVIFEDKILAYAHQLDDELILDNNSNNRNVQILLEILVKKIENKELGYKTISKQIFLDLKNILNEVG